MEQTYKISGLKNFAVQGDIEKVAQQTPIELTRFFELVSGSDALRDDYEQLQTAVEQADGKTAALSVKSRALASRKKLMKEAKEEAERYQHLLCRKVHNYTPSFAQFDSTLPTE
jgi:structural maintenance of chromosome 1